MSEEAVPLIVRPDGCAFNHDVQFWAGDPVPLDELPKVCVVCGAEMSYKNFVGFTSALPGSVTVTNWKETEHPSWREYDREIIAEMSAPHCHESLDGPPPGKGQRCHLPEDHLSSMNLPCDYSLDWYCAKDPAPEKS